MVTLSTLRPTAPSLADIAALPQGDDTPLKDIRGIGTRRGPLGLLLRPTARRVHKRVARTIVNELKAGYRANDAQAKGLLKLVLAHLQGQGVARISTFGDVRLAQRFVQEGLVTMNFKRRLDQGKWRSNPEAVKARLERTIAGGIAGLREVLAPLVAALGSDLTVEIGEGRFANDGALTVSIEDSEDPNKRQFQCEFAMNENENSGKVSLDYLQVWGDRMGGAHAKAVLKALVELIRRSEGGCLKTIELEANINIGTYAWAKAFHPRDQTQLKNIMEASIGRFTHYRRVLKGAMAPKDFTSLEKQISQFKQHQKYNTLDNHHFDALRNIKLPVDMRKAKYLCRDPTLEDVKEAVKKKKMAAGKLLMILSSDWDGAWGGKAEVGDDSWKDLLLYLYPNAPGPRDL